MKHIVINTENDYFQELLAIKNNRQKRKQKSLFMIESVAAIKMMIEKKYYAREIIIEDGKRLSHWATQAVDELKPEKIIRLTKDLMENISDKEDSSELIALCSFINFSLNDILLTANSAIVLIDKPSNPGNLGSIIRTCNAFNIQAVITTGHCVDQYDPVVIRSSMGAFFATPVVYEPSKEILINWLLKQKEGFKNLQIIGTDSKGSIRLKDCRIRLPVVVCIGNEASGLSQKIIDIVDAMVSIPVIGDVDSLNAACAASIILYEFTKASVKGGSKNSMK